MDEDNFFCKGGEMTQRDKLIQKGEPLSYRTDFNDFDVKSDVKREEGNHTLKSIPQSLPDKIAYTVTNSKAGYCIVDFCIKNNNNPYGDRDTIKNELVKELMDIFEKDNYDWVVDKVMKEFLKDDYIHKDKVGVCTICKGVKEIWVRQSPNEWLHTEPCFKCEGKGWIAGKGEV